MQPRIDILGKTMKKWQHCCWKESMVVLGENAGKQHYDTNPHAKKLDGVATLIADPFRFPPLTA